MSQILAEDASAVEIVRHFSHKIKNGRTVLDATRHTADELRELNEEIEKKQNGELQGPDGIIGEAIDIIACAIDIIFLERPDMPEEEINDYLKLKCEKWAKHYSDTVDKAIAPTQAGQKVRVRSSRIDDTELNLDTVYEVEEVINYDWQHHQHSKVRIVDQPAAIYADEVFYVVEG
jgi:hypothetical protein